MSRLTKGFGSARNSATAIPLPKSNRKEKNKVVDLARSVDTSDTAPHSQA
jgi:hypothetical protein